MSVLRKKLQIKERAPAAYKSLPKYCIGMFEQMAGYLENVLGREIEYDQISQGPKFEGGKNIDTYKHQMSGLLFAIGHTEAVHADAECEILIEVSTALATTIISTKLGGQPKKSGPKDQKFTMFELLITQRLVEHALDQLQDLGATKDKDAILDRRVSIDGFKTVKFARKEPWIKLDFPISLKAGQNKAPTAENKKQSAKKQSANSTKLGDLNFSIYLTQQIADNIVRVGAEQQNQKIIDPTNPWSQHMRGTTRTARHAVEIVVEDLKLSIAECTRLELGQVIALPGASHERLNLKLPSSGGKIIISTATLGAFKSNKAVKLNEDIDPDFLGEFPNE